MNVNFKVSEIQELLWILDRISCNSEVEGEIQATPVVVDAIQSKLKEANEVTRWNPISTLIPLGQKVLVKHVPTGEMKFVVRHDLADSYAPIFQKVVEVGTQEVLELQLGQHRWTRNYD